MTLDAAFERLLQQRGALHDAIRALRSAIQDHEPTAETGTPKPVDDLQHAAEELLNRFEDFSATVQASRDDAVQGDLSGLKRALAQCHESFLAVQRWFLDNIASFDGMSRIQRFGRQRSGEWPGWADTVVAQSSGCQEPLYELNACLFQCWHELAEKIGSHSATAFAVGQEIHLRDGARRPRGQPIP